jgi:hypothetical protein
MNTFKQDLIKLGTTNPELRPHIRQLLAGCEKLPEGGMRDNCEKKVEEGGKEAGFKTAGRGVSISMEIRGHAIELVKAQQQQDEELSLMTFYAMLKGMESYSYMVLGSPALRVLMAKAADQLDTMNDGMLSSGRGSAPTV